ncbi:MAG: glycosyltransferase [bacterium]|jgi:glycosyltransferase involved in cell wall biosynthesis
MPRKEPVPVAYVLPNLELGGTERHVLDLAAAIDRRKFSPRVVCTAGGGSMEEEFSRRGVPVHVLEYRGISLKPGKAGPLFRNARSFFRAFTKILAENNIRILHCYLPAGNILGMAAASLHRTPVKIVSKRGLCQYKDGHPLFSFFEDLANLFSDGILVNSLAVEADVRRTERFLGGKISLLYNGIDPEVPPPSPVGNLFPGIAWREDDPIVCCVANFFPYKGHRDLVEAAHTVVESFPHARFLLVGRDSGEMGAVRDRIEALGLSANVLLTGERDDAARIIAASTLVVHPSHTEGFPNTILEAMAAGKPVVATDAGGIPEAVVDGTTGIIVPVGDPGKLADGLLALIRDPVRARAMGQAGRIRLLERFTIGKMVEGMEQFYGKLLARRT